MNVKLQLPGTQIDSTEAWAEVRANCLASKRHIKWLGVTRSLTADQIDGYIGTSSISSAYRVNCLPETA